MSRLNLLFICLIAFLSVHSVKAKTLSKTDVDCGILSPDKYQQAKYVVCDTQFYVSMIDLTHSDLSQGKFNQLKYGIKYCFAEGAPESAQFTTATMEINQDDPVMQGHQTIRFSGLDKNVKWGRYVYPGKPDLSVDFTPRGSADLWASLGGNSGECTFRTLPIIPGCEPQDFVSFEEIKPCAAWPQSQ